MPPLFRVAIDDSVERYLAVFVQGSGLPAGREDADLVSLEDSLPITFEHGSKLTDRHFGVATLKLSVADGLLVSARLMHHFCSFMNRGEVPVGLGIPVLCDIRRLTVDYA